MNAIFAQADFCLAILSELEFRRSLHIVTRPKRSKAGADAIEYPIGFGILLLPGELDAPQIIRHEMVRGNFSIGSMSSSAALYFPSAMLTLARLK